MEKPASRNSGQEKRVAFFTAAWIAYVGILLSLLILFLLLLLVVSGGDTTYLPSDPPTRNALFYVAMAWIALATPAGFFLRQRLFKAYEKGRPVAPGRYLEGMLCIWIPLFIGGLIAIVGGFQAQSITPFVVPWMVAVVLLFPFWPSGQAMTRNLGDSRDFELYKEPR